jgi:hypothetical protein
VKILKLGAIAALTGRSAKMGTGVVDSLRFILRRKEGQLFSKGIKLDLIVRDDKGDPLRSLESFVDLEREGVFCVVGPCDSECVHSIISQKGTSEVSEVPIVTPLATTSILTELGAPNFFRMTTPDRIRADMLVRLLRRMHPQRCVFVYAINDSAFSYSRQLRFDVTKSLDDHGLRWQLEELKSANLPSQLPEDGQPVVICGSSEDVVKVTLNLRRIGSQASVFAFGSNSNLLLPELAGTIVIADLDREDTNAQIREEIEHFIDARVSSGDPSLAAMNCMTLLVNLLLQGPSFIDMDLGAIRQSVTSILRHGPLRGLFGPVAFTDTGEMIGWEHVSVLRISVIRGEPVFRGLAGGDDSPIEEKRRHSLAGATKIFISHSSKDTDIVGALVQLLRSSLDLTAKSIRCTSISGFRLEAGDVTEKTLREELLGSPVFIVLATEASLRSAFVLFESGARWGADLGIVILLGGVRPEYLKGPMKSYNALDCSDAGQIHQLIEDVGRKLGRPVPRPTSYQKELDEFLSGVRQRSSRTKHRRARNPGVAADG